MTNLNIKNIAVNAYTSAFGKATRVDLPTYLMFQVPGTFDKTIVAGGAYVIRSAGNQIVNEIFELKDDECNKQFYSQNCAIKLTGAVVSGFVAGSTKYYINGQNPIVGGFNQAAYEVCNNFKACGDNIKSFVFVVETLDSVAQVSIGIATGNPIGMLEGLSKIGGAALTGLKISAAVCFNIDTFYVPYLKEMAKNEALADISENSFMGNITNNTVYSDSRDEL